MRSNTTEWSTDLTLITRTVTADADGYESAVESKRHVFCNYAMGVSRGEFYEALKAGLRLSAEVEVHYFDYAGEKLAEVDGTRYKVVRTYPTDLDTVILVLEEAIR